MAFRVFISYSSRDLTRTAQVKGLLEATGARVFVAESSLPAGADLAAAIKREIAECDLFVLLWSHHAQRSEWVPQEIGIATAHAKPIIPIVLHKSATVPGFIKGLKYLPLYKDPENALRALQREVAGAAKHKSAQESITWAGVLGVLLWLMSLDKRGPTG